MQIYGIDLAKEKFDVSFFDLTSKKVSNYQYTEEDVEKQWGELLFHGGEMPGETHPLP